MISLSHKFAFVHFYLRIAVAEGKNTITKVDLGTGVFVAGKGKSVGKPLARLAHGGNFARADMRCQGWACDCDAAEQQ